MVRVRWRGVLQALLAVVCVGGGLGLVLSWLATWISPADFWMPALLGLAFPVSVLSNLILLVVLLLFRSRWSLVPLAALLLTVPLHYRYFQFRFGGGEPPAASDSVLRVLSYNVNLFRLYSWSESSPTFEAIDSVCRSLSADVICFQEFYTHDSKFNPVSAPGRFLDTGHIYYLSHNSGGGHYGLAIFSRHPIVSSGELLFEESANATIFVDVAVGKDTLRVYNNHLQSFRLDRDNLAFLRSPRLEGEGETYREVRSLARRLRWALRKRAVQVDNVRAHIEASPYPVIVTGDFNDSPISYTYSRMRGGTLEDAFCEAGQGFGVTYNGLFPSFRIDYILYSPLRFTLTDFQVQKIDYSDHYPIVGDFLIR